MLETIILFVYCLAIAIVPGPLAIVAFYGGTLDKQIFFSGLLGQLIGLAILTNVLSYTSTTIYLYGFGWVRILAGLGLIFIGCKAIYNVKTDKRNNPITFASAFMLTLTNPKALLGLVPAVIVYHGESLTVVSAVISTFILSFAISLAMTFYYFLGLVFKQSDIVIKIKNMSGFLLISLGLLIAFRQLFFNT